MNTENIIEINIKSQTFFNLPMDINPDMYAAKVIKKPDDISEIG